MSLDEDIRKISGSKTLKKAKDVSKLIYKQVKLIDSFPNAVLGKATALNLRNWLDTRKAYGENYPCIEKSTNIYLSLHGYISKREGKYEI